MSLFLCIPASLVYREPLIASVCVLATEEGHRSMTETFGKKSCFWTTHFVASGLVSVELFYWQVK